MKISIIIIERIIHSIDFDICMNIILTDYSHIDLNIQIHK
jgi:hypothetical protein